MIHLSRPQQVLLLLLVIPGAAAMVVFAAYAWQDWVALQQAYTRFEQAVMRSSDLPTLFSAEAKQRIHRDNLFAEGVWTLLAGIIAAIGVHGICTSRKAGHSHAS
jgi:hypothetical protein